MVDVPYRTGATVVDVPYRTGATVVDVPTFTGATVVDVPYRTGIAVVMPVVVGYETYGTGAAVVKVFFGICGIGAFVVLVE